MSKIAKNRIMCDCCGREISYDSINKRQMLTVRTHGLLVQESSTGDVCSVCREILIPYVERIGRVVGDLSRKQVPYEPWNTEWEDCERGPAARIYLDLEEIAEGEFAILYWETKNATDVTINGNVVDATGEMLVSPPETTRYTIIAEGADFSATAYTTLIVMPSEDIGITFDSLINGAYVISETQGRIIRQYGSQQSIDLDVITQVQADVSDTYLTFTVHKANSAIITYSIDQNDVDQTLLRELLADLGLSKEQDCTVTSINVEMSSDELMVQVWFTYSGSETYHKYYFERQ